MPNPEERINEPAVEPEVQEPEEPASTEPESDDGDEYIIPPGVVEQPAKEEKVEEPTQAPSQDEPIVEKQDDSAVEIDGKKYNSDELQQIISAGKKVHEYSKEHPGFDPVLLHADYTKKSMELAELKRKMQADPEPQQPKPIVEPPKVSKKELEDVAKEMNMDPNDLKNLKTALSALGYVPKEEIEQEFQRREQAKTQSVYAEERKTQINNFLSKHPEYNIGSKENDERWAKLLEHMNSLYKIPEDPKKISLVLEKAHSDLTGSKPNFNVENVSKVIAQKKVNDIGKSTSRGGGAAPAQKKLNNSVADLARSGGLRGFSQKELEELLSN